MSHSTKVSFPDETHEWLKENYPDAMSDAERVRMAISDAREAKEERQKAIQALVQEQQKHD